MRKKNRPVFLLSLWAIAYQFIYAGSLEFPAFFAGRFLEFDSDGSGSIQSTELRALIKAEMARDG